MYNLNKTKKHLKAIKKDFETNNYHKKPEKIIIQKDFTQTEFKLVVHLGKLIESGRFKLPTEIAFNLEDIAKTNGLTLEKLEYLVFEDMAIEEIKKEYGDLRKNK